MMDTFETAIAAFLGVLFALGILAIRQAIRSPKRQLTGSPEYADSAAARWCGGVSPGE